MNTKVSKRKRAEENDEDAPEAIIRVHGNCIYYRGEIKEPEATDFCVKLGKKVKEQKDKTDGVVNIYISSGGGDAFAGLMMYEHIKYGKASVAINTIADGYIASAATFPFLAGTKRLMYTTASMLIHPVRSGQFGYFKPNEMENEAKSTQVLMNIINTLYQNHGTLKKKEQKQIMEEERLLTYEDCVKYGFVDAIPS